VKLVFLDRDGVINEFPGNGNYVTKLKEFHFIPRALDAVKLLTDEGYSIFVISNQAGVGKGIYSKQKLNHITRNMLVEVKQTGGKIKKVFYCTHRSNEGCDCRKPGIGLVRRALELMDKNIHMAQKAFFVGDTEVDILAGHNAGCKTIFVLSGREDYRHMRGWVLKPDYVAKDLWEAALIIQHENSLHKEKLKKNNIGVKTLNRQKRS
jgi:D-glycero-D-manno-heptose 1,7-bisphosphate phosphatase